MSFFNAFWGTAEIDQPAVQVAVPPRPKGTLTIKVERPIAATTTMVRDEVAVRVKVRETVPVEPPKTDMPKKPRLTKAQLKADKRAKAAARRDESYHPGERGNILMRRGIMIAEISGRKPHEERA